MPDPVLIVFWKLNEMGLKPRRCGDGYSAMCPVHENDGANHTPSLTFAAGSTQPLVMQCHAGCSLGDILARMGLGLTDIMAIVRDEPHPDSVVTEADVSRWMESLFNDAKRLRWIEQNRQLDVRTILSAELGWDSDTNNYVIPIRDASGRLLSCKRYNPDGKPKYKMAEGARTSLYGVDQLGRLNEGHLVVVCEGEFDAMLCRTLGYEAVTSTSGASSWQSGWGNDLRKFEVVACGDFDDPGEKYSKAVCTSVRSVGGFAQPVIWPTSSKDKTDVTSFVATHGAAAFHDMIHEAQKRGKLKCVDISQIFSGELEPIPWVVEGWLADGDVAIIGGEPGAGKSMVLLDLALSLATGSAFLRHLPVHGGPRRVMVVDEENNIRLCRRRIQQFMLGADVGPEDLATLQLHYLTDNSLNLDDDAMAKRFYRECREFRPDWILMDSLVRFHNREENSNTEMASFFAKRLKPLIRDFKCGLIILHHLSKPGGEGSSKEIGHRLRGASDIRGVPDEIWGLEGDAETNERTLRHEKCRWDMLQRPLRMAYQTSADATSAWLAAADEGEATSSMILRALKGADAAGVLRGDIVELLRNEGFRSADKTASVVLARMVKLKQAVKKREKKNMRYWLAEMFDTTAFVMSAATEGGG